jgi:hypothetical protein
MIDQWKKAFTESWKANKETEKGKGGKWGSAKKEEKNWRAIDGKPMYYVHKTKRWEDDEKETPEHTAGKVATNIPPPEPPAPTVPAPSPTSSTSVRSTGKEVAEVNLKQQINLAMQGIANIMCDAWWLGRLSSLTGVSQMSWFFENIPLLFVLTLLSFLILQDDCYIIFPI